MGFLHLLPLLFASGTPKDNCRRKPGPDPFLFSEGVRHSNPGDATDSGDDKRPRKRSAVVFAGRPTSFCSPPPGTIRLEFEVLQECWVSVNRDGSRVLVKILEPGDDQSFSATEQFYLVLGNAGGVRLKINGKQVKPLGKRGEVVRVLINGQNIKDLVEKTSG